MKARFLGLLLAACVLRPSAAWASTIPTLDLARGKVSLAVGGLPLPLLGMVAGTLAVDYALTATTSVGAVACPWGLVGARLVGRVPQGNESVALGWSVEGGLVGPMTRADTYGSWYSNLEGGRPPARTAAERAEQVLLRQPNVSTVLHPSLLVAASKGPLTVRCAIGPAWVLNTTHRAGGLIFDNFLTMVINPEIGWRVLPQGELTVSGQGLMGWRQTF